MTCSYAGCTLPAATVEDGWSFCLRHLAEHRALRDGRGDRLFSARRGETSPQTASDRLGQPVHEWALAARKGTARRGWRDTADLLHAVTGGDINISGETLRAWCRGWPRPKAPCGTHTAYVRHGQLGEPIDQACRDGQRRYDRERKRQRAGSEPVRAVREAS